MGFLYQSNMKQPLKNEAKEEEAHDQSGVHCTLDFSLPLPGLFWPSRLSFLSLGHWGTRTYCFHSTHWAGKHPNKKVDMSIS